MDGSLIIDKPAGITSHDVVARVRRAFKIKRVGHAGTLDPFATGVLVVCVGAATRLVQHLVGLDKEYLATVRLGFATTTQDLTGEPISETRDAQTITQQEVRSALTEFTGEQRQTPPMFSAKKIGGRKLYELARLGETVEREPVAISIYSVELMDRGDGPLLLRDDCTVEFNMRVRCSSGTYIRTLANDLGERLGYGGHLTALRRTRVGEFEIARSITLEELEARAASGDAASALVSPSATAGHLARVVLTDEEAARVMHGREVYTDGFEPGAFVRLCDQNDNLIAVGQVAHDGGVIRPRTVLCGA